VLAGRAPIFGLAAAGEAGVQHVLELLQEELALTMCLLGCTSLEELTRAHLQRAIA
jgi:isopentenyl diphosphate isomerase/L-lactate dehydrogenase-like FMN-dependent dehydrogenase